MKSKLKPKKGTKIILVETNVKSVRSGSDFYNSTIYYVDTKRRVIWEEEGLDFTSIVKKQGMVLQDDERYYHAWVGRKKQRSVAELVRKYDRDFDMFKHMLTDFQLEVTEIGVL